MSNLKEKLDHSIFIPTKNRPKWIEYSLMHYDCFNYKGTIIIHDDSDSKYFLENSKIILKFSKKLNIEHLKREGLDSKAPRHKNMIAGYSKYFRNIKTTHYATEDFACIRAIGGTNIYTPSDNFITQKLAEKTIVDGKLNYIRLDRHPTAEINFDSKGFDIKEGFRIIGDYTEDKIAIISHGRILHNCLKTLNAYKDKCFVVDIYNSKPISEKLIYKLKNISKILVVDEQTCSGNLTSAIQEVLSKHNLIKYVKNVSLTERYIFENGGREYLLKSNKLDENSILNYFKELL